MRVKGPFNIGCMNASSPDFSYIFTLILSACERITEHILVFEHRMRHTLAVSVLQPDAMLPRAAE